MTSQERDRLPALQKARFERTKKQDAHVAKHRRDEKAERADQLSPVCFLKTGVECCARLPRGLADGKRWHGKFPNCSPALELMHGALSSHTVPKI
jgi:hypothetical protein